MAGKSYYQQFQDIEATFKNSFSYENTGAYDYSEIVLRFFIDATVLKKLSAKKHHVAAEFLINRDMKHYTVQFGKMLGNEKGLEKVDKLAEQAVALIGNVQCDINDVHTYTNNLIPSMN